MGPRRPSGQSRGTTPVGIASQAFKHGRRSKYAPHRPALALGAYSQAPDSRELLALREEIALVDAQIISALEAMKVVPEDEPSKLVACRAEIASLADQRRKLVESERKSYREAQEILTAERAPALFAELVCAVRRHVQDRAESSMRSRRCRFILI